MNNLPSDHENSQSKLESDNSDILIRNELSNMRLASAPDLQGADNEPQFNPEQIPAGLKLNDRSRDREKRYSSLNQQFYQTEKLTREVGAMEIDTQLVNENSEMTNELLLDFTSPKNADYQLDFKKQIQILQNGGKNKGKEVIDHSKDSNIQSHGHSHGIISPQLSNGDRGLQQNFQVLSPRNSNTVESEIFDSRIEDFGIKGDIDLNPHSVKCKKNDTKHKTFIQLMTQSSRENDEGHGHDHDSAASDAFMEQSDLEDSSCSNLSQAENKDPLEVAHDYIQNYYEQNYDTKNIFNIKDYVHQSAWSVHFDEIYDKAFVTIASIEIDEQINNTGNMLITSSIPPPSVEHLKKVSKPTWQNIQSKINRSSPAGVKNSTNLDRLLKHSHKPVEPSFISQAPSGSHQEHDDHDPNLYQAELDGIKQWKDPQVNFTLKLLTFNLDDRILKTKGIDKKPQKEKIMVKVQQGLTGSFSKFQIMQFFKNMYIDYSQITQHNDTTYLFKNLYNIVIYDRVPNSKPLPPIKVFPDLKLNTFKMLILFKENQTKFDREISKVLVLGYKQTQIMSEQNQNKLQEIRLDSQESQEQISNEQWDQRLVLKTIDLEILKKNSQQQNQASAVVHQDIDIQNDRLIEYYKKDLLNRKLGRIMVQQIENQSSLILLFPTGLIFTIAIDPLTAVSTSQLSIKSDDTILDHCYSICETGMSHCIWILDSNMQVWKCNSPLTAHQGNWTMTRQIKFNMLPIKLFFQQATTYDKCSMIQHMLQMKEFLKTQTNRLNKSEQLIGFNCTATKCIIIQQPEVPLKVKVSLENFDGDAACYLEHIFCISQKQILQNKIKIQLIAKEQSIIMSHIPFKAPIKQDIQSKLKNILTDQFIFEVGNDENEILELQYLQKVNLKDTKTTFLRQYRQFLVRRMRSLQILFTNGLFHWSVDVKKSHLKTPFVIQDIMLSEDNSTLVDYCSIPGYPEQSFYRFYRYCDGSKSFVLQKKQVSGSRDLTNMSLDDNGEAFYISFNLTDDKVIKNQYRASVSIKKINDQMILQIPRQIIFQQLLNAKNELPKVMTSNDGRILMCNYLIIQLSEDKNTILEIGCITYERQQSLIYYNFRSLLEVDSRSMIHSLLKNSKHNVRIANIVKFDIENEPFSIEKDINVLYFTNYLIDPAQVYVEGTSVIKMSTKSLSCLEIYRTKDKIVHFTLYDHDQDQEVEADMELQKELIVSDLLQTNTTVKRKDLERIYKMAQAKMPSQADLAQIENPSSPISSHSSSRSSSSSFDSQNQNIRNKKPVVVCSDDIMQPNSDASVKEALSSIVNTQKAEDQLKTKRRGAILHQKTIQRKETQVVSPMTNSSKIKKSKKDQDKILKDKKPIFISLVSQTKHRINIEIILDLNIPGQDLGKVSGMTNKKQEFQIQKFGSKLVYLITVNVKKDIKLTSEIGWINMTQFILTLDNHYYLITINKNGMHSIKEGVKFDRQQINGDLFVSIISQDFTTSLVKKPSSRRQQLSNDSFQLKDNNSLMIKAQNVIQRMEIASLIRYAFIKQAKEMSSTNNIENLLLFFTPCEEMKGGSIFSKLSNNYDIIQPYIEKIDAKFIDILNNRIRNTNNYLNKNIEKGHFINQLRKNTIKKAQLQQSDNLDFLSELVHMYQEDITGKNAIDNAFDKNSIFCIKLFVDSLLQLKNEVHFKNCFDKALIMMINKGMDVKELVNSKIFYTPLWSQHIIFSTNKQLQVKSYNNDALDLHYENPHDIFSETIQQTKSETKKNQNSGLGETIRPNNDGQLTVKAQIQQGLGHHCKSECDNFDNEQHEMQFNCINLDLICQEFKFKQFDLIKALNASNDLKLFELEPIQCIIDFKWETYGRMFFKRQLIIYGFYVISFYVDMISIHKGEGLHHPRVKDNFFWFNKFTCIIVQLYFFVYKMLQLYHLNQLHYDDISSYLQVTSIILYIVGSLIDIVSDILPPICQIIYGTSCIFSLANVLFLIRVYQELSFLVILMTKVIQDLFYFLLLFLFFVNQIGVCFMILEVDSSAYGRQSYFLSMTYTTLRAAFGDFSILDPYMTFDMYEINEETGEKEYLHPTHIVTFTFIVFVFQSFILFMVFMNFIIAIIGESYASVIEFRNAHDYKQRVGMIFERELFIPFSTINDQEMFPKFLIVRKKKQTEASANDSNSLLNQIKQIKTFIQDQTEIQKQTLNDKSNEQKEHQYNSIKHLENEFAVHRNIMMKQFTFIEKNLKNLTHKVNTISNPNMGGSDCQSSYVGSNYDKDIRIINQSSQGSQLDMNSSVYGYDMPNHDLEGATNQKQAIQINRLLIKENPYQVLSDPTSPQQKEYYKSFSRLDRSSSVQKQKRWKKKMNQLSFDPSNILPPTIKRSDIEKSQTQMYPNMQRANLQQSDTFLQSQQFQLTENSTTKFEKEKEVLRRFNDPDNPVIRRALEQRKLRSKSQAQAK